jgi:phage shock protein PspC (stress-responsive transcriptional regulator)
MNEIKKIHLGRQQFTIAIEAYKELHEYLEAIEKQPGVQAEVTKEVEARMAELLTERGVTPDKVVLSEDVAFLKEQLGEPHDFKDDEDDAEKQAPTSQEASKRLYRDTDTALIAGVGSGLAAYLGIDSVIVRLIFVLLTFASGAGIVLYILLWLIVPEAKTTSERLQMRGKAVTVDSLKNVIDRADIAGASERASRSFGRLISQVVNGIFKAVLTVIGAAFVTAGAAVMLWAIATATYMLVHGGQIGTAIVFPLGAQEVWTVILAFVASIIVGFLIVMVGLTMIARKWRLPGWISAAIIGIFFVVGGIGTALAFDTVPHIRDRFRAAHHTQNVSVDQFQSANLHGQDTVFSFKPDTKTYVELSYLGDVETKTLVTKVENGVLTVDTAAFVAMPGWCSGICFYSDHDMKVTIHAPSLDRVTVTGTDSSFIVDDQLNQPSMTIDADRRVLQQVRIGHLQTDSLAVTDNLSQERRVFELSGIKPNASADEELRADQSVVHVASTDHLQLRTADQCDLYGAKVYVQKTPLDFTVNNQLVQGADALKKMQSQDTQNQYNCIAVQ